EKFQDELESLISECIKLGKECHKRLARAVEILVADDIEEARNLVKADVEINKMEAAINAHSINLITTQAPVASDLRLIISCIKSLMISSVPVIILATLPKSESALRLQMSVRFSVLKRWSGWLH